MVPKSSSRFCVTWVLQDCQDRFGDHVIRIGQMFDQVKMVSLGNLHPLRRKLLDCLWGNEVGNFEGKRQKQARMMDLSPRRTVFPGQLIRVHHFARKWEKFSSWPNSYEPSSDWVHGVGKSCSPRPRSVLEDHLWTSWECQWGPDRPLKGTCPWTRIALPEWENRTKATRRGWRTNGHRQSDLIAQSTFHQRGQNESSTRNLHSNAQRILERVGGKNGTSSFVAKICLTYFYVSWQIEPTTDPMKWSPPQFRSSLLKVFVCLH